MTRAAVRLVVGVARWLDRLAWRLTGIELPPGPFYAENEDEEMSVEEFNRRMAAGAPVDLDVRLDDEQQGQEK